MYALSAAESEARHGLEMEIRARERRREYGLSEEEEEADLLRRQHFNNVTLPELDTQLRIVCQSYEVSYWLSTTNYNLNQFVMALQSSD